MMPRDLRWKVPLIIGVILWACWYTFPLKERIRLGLDLQGGMHLILGVDVAKLPPEARADAPARALEVIRNRIDQFGVSEPVIQRQGEHHIVVQLPGITDRERALNLIGRTAQLELKLVADDPRLVDQAIAGSVPLGYELLRDDQGQPLLLEREASLTGSALVDARVEFGDYGLPEVDFQLNAEGARKFATLTGANIGRRLAILLDNKVLSAPVIQSRISDRGRISGRFTREEAADLAISLRAGALPAPIVIEEERTVGPTLGQDSVRAGVRATLIGGGLVVAFMAVYYLFAGVVAVVALALNLLLILGALGYFHATLTLPGIAGIILTLGMAVDANVLIYERIREELKTGRPLKMAIRAGYDKAFSAILDSNVTTLIAAALLFQFGTGPIRGFGVTLMIGLFASMFTAIIVTRTIFELLQSWGLLKGLPMLHLIGETKMDFIGKRAICYALSGLAIVAGAAAFLMRGEAAYGIDFRGGQIQEYRFAQPASVETVRQALAQVGLADANIQSFANSPRDLLIRTQGESAVQVQQALKTALPDNSAETLRIEQVGPAVGKDLRQRALLSIVWAMAGILGYVAFRFRHFDFGLAGIIALIHDVVIAVAALALTQREMSLTIVAALLTIAGYSINDTIVIYDRVRENLRTARKTMLAEVINLTVNQMLGRTLLTSLTVLLTVLSLLFFGGEVLGDFAFVMLVGLISGVYSTVYIASAFVITWRGAARTA